MPEWLWRAAYLATRPDYLARAVLRRWPGASFRTRLTWDAVERPAYGYGVYHAALDARALGLERISVIEFGVAGGNGLVALEKIAEEVSKETGVAIDVYGFDSGTGMPPPADHRDVPYLWHAGFFSMDQAKLKSRLKRAELVLGPVSETAAAFLHRRRPAPIGFVSFDLDYYSSTVAAFKIWEGESSFFLPRVVCYFDDMSPGISQHAGEFLAIAEFNESHPRKKIDPIKSLAYLRRIPSLWNEQMYMLHDFSHPLYARPLNPGATDQLPLSA